MNNEIIYLKPRKQQEIIKILHPLVKEWFFSKFKEFSMTQLYGVMPIWERKNLLISAPTGGTKTLSSFLAILNYLVSLSEKQELEDKIYCVYASPLKALSGDIYVNLIKPLEEIQKIADNKKIKLQEIRVALRTGDTSADEKQKQAKKSPHILITTPESLSIVLTTTKFVENLRSVEFLIIDEIHALSNKRGVYLSLSLERLENLSVITPVRIGLSATISPLEEIAGFLVGSGRSCLIAEVRFEKKIDLQVLCPVQNMVNTDSIEKQSSLYKMIDDLIQEHKTTLIFTNTRAATERVINHLKEMFPKRYLEDIGAHHGSLSKEHRLNLENRLREGKLKVVVSSTSLELGIDIGYIDLVIMLGSPKSTARAMQRIGRSGHKLHETIKGRFIVLDRDDLVECCVMLKEILENKIDKVQIPKNCLDVLAQQIYGMAISRIWKINEMYDLIRKSYCYQDLRYDDFLSVISYLSGEYALEDKYVYAKIWYDEETGEIGKKGKLARVIYMTNIGTIPDESFVKVILKKDGKEIQVGVIDESFFERIKKGDVFVLGGSKYLYLYGKGMKAYVSGSVNKAPTIPSWFSEMLPLSFDLALEIQRFRKLIKEKINKKQSKQEIKDFIMSFLYVDEKISTEILDYLSIQEKFLGIPNEKELIIENYKGDKNYFIFHSLFGRRVNDALSRSIGFCVGRIGGRDIELGINDNCFYITGENVNQEKIERAFNFLNEKNLDEVLKEAIEKSEILKRRFRHCASRALMILRNYKGNIKSVGKQYMRSWFLLNAIRKKDDNFCVLKETRREILEDVMDIQNTKKVIRLIKNHKIKITYKSSNLPSPFSLNLVIQGYSDLIKIEDKIAFIKRVYDEIKKKID